MILVRMRAQFVIVSRGLLLIVAAASALWPPAWLSLFVILPLIGRGVADMLQTKQAATTVR